MKLSAAIKTYFISVAKTTAFAVVTLRDGGFLRGRIAILSLRCRCANLLRAGIYDRQTPRVYPWLFIFFNAFLLILALSLVSGCSSTPTATYKVNSVNYLNPDIYGRASPVVLTIYQLKSEYAFQQATYQELTANSAKVLGGDLIDKDTVEVRPSDALKVTQPISPNAQYIGIVAAYRDINQATWHKIIKIEQEKGKHPVLYVTLQSQGFTVRVEYSRNFL